jgi:hypothetical protein
MLVQAGVAFVIEARTEMALNALNHQLPDADFPVADHRIGKAGIGDRHGGGFP